MIAGDLADKVTVFTAMTANGAESHGTQRNLDRDVDMNVSAMPTVYDERSAASAANAASTGPPFVTGSSYTYLQRQLGNEELKTERFVSRKTARSDNDGKRWLRRKDNGHFAYY